MEVRNIKYSYYEKRTGRGPFETTHNGGIVGVYGAYPTVEALLQSALRQVLNTQNKLTYTNKI